MREDNIEIHYIKHNTYNWAQNIEVILPKEVFNVSSTVNGGNEKPLFFYV